LSASEGDRGYPEACPCGHKFFDRRDQHALNKLLRPHDFDIGSQEEAGKLVDNLEDATYRVAQIKNVLIAIYKLSSYPAIMVDHPLLYTHAWFPRDKFEEVIEQEGGSLPDWQLALYRPMVPSRVGDRIDNLEASSAAVFPWRIHPLEISAELSRLQE
jgi:hypothetical protein